MLPHTFQFVGKRSFSFLFMLIVQIHPHAEQEQIMEINKILPQPKSINVSSNLIPRHYSCSALSLIPRIKVIRSRFLAYFWSWKKIPTVFSIDGTFLYY